MKTSQPTTIRPSKPQKAVRKRLSLCPVCKCTHEGSWPHLVDSLPYREQFFRLRGRYPTHDDAAAHCTPRDRMLWRARIEAAGEHWTTRPESAERRAAG